MKYFSYKSKTSVLIVAVTFISACGGGSSSSDAPSGERYTGNQEITVAAIGSSESTSEPFVLTVNGDSVFITDNGDPAFTASGKLSGSNFTATGSITGTEEGVQCTLNATYTGSIVNGETTGTITGDSPCTGSFGSVTLDISGSFTAKR